MDAIEECLGRSKGCSSSFTPIDRRGRTGPESNTPLTVSP